MRCQRCGHNFPGRKGRFCGTCLPDDSPARVACEILIDLLAENAHLLVGGVALQQKRIDRLLEVLGRPNPEGKA